MSLQFGSRDLISGFFGIFGLFAISVIPMPCLTFVYNCCFNFSPPSIVPENDLKSPAFASALALEADTPDTSVASASLSPELTIENLSIPKSFRYGLICVSKSSLRSEPTTITTSSYCLPSSSNASHGVRIFGLSIIFICGNIALKNVILSLYSSGFFFGSLVLPVNT